MRSITLSYACYPNTHIVISQIVSLIVVLNTGCFVCGVDVAQCSKPLPTHQLDHIPEHSNMYTQELHPIYLNTMSGMKLQSLADVVTAPDTGRPLVVVSHHLANFLLGPHYRLP
jgi:hypothetical protein